MIHDRLELINEEFHAGRVEAAVYDRLLADAWRHFGTQFFRYNFGIYQNEIRRVLPLRVRLADFRLSESQRRVLRRNSDVEVQIEPVAINDEIERLFDSHRRRFETGVPDSIYDFLSYDAASVPTEGFQITARLDGRLAAASFFDIGITSISAIYACFDPDESARSLGIFTMLKVIEHAASLGKTFYYHGYAYEGHSFYDYKKRFAGTEVFDWKGTWNIYRSEVETPRNE